MTQRRKQGRACQKVAEHPQELRQELHPKRLLARSPERRVERLAI
jgi:hypothetical protein